MMRDFSTVSALKSEFLSLPGELVFIVEAGGKRYSGMASMMTEVGGLVVLKYASAQSQRKQILTEYGLAGGSKPKKKARGVAEFNRRMAALATPEERARVKKADRELKAKARAKK